MAQIELLLPYQTGYKADIYLFGQDALHRWGLDNRHRLEINPVHSI